MTDTMVICGLSALDYWRKAAGAEFDASYERLWEGMRVARPCGTVYSRAADLLVSLGLPAPLHLLADSPGNRRTSLFAVFHTYREPPLDHDLIELSPHVIVCSPVLAIAQAASTVSPAELDLLYLEFCGTYLRRNPCLRRFKMGRGIQRARRTKGFRCSSALLRIPTLRPSLPATLCSAFLAPTAALASPG